MYEVWTMLILVRDPHSIWWRAAVSHRRGRNLPTLTRPSKPPPAPPAMASNLSTRAVRSACTASKVAPRPLATLLPRRSFTTTPESSTTQEEQPRWSYTPPRAQAPFSLRLHSKRPSFWVNSDPEVLDKFYIRMLGNGGDKVLSDELKWLAVTHKSFDQGRRGFNDRLAFLGTSDNNGCWHHVAWY